MHSAGGRIQTSPDLTVLGHCRLVKKFLEYMIGHSYSFKANVYFSQHSIMAHPQLKAGKVLFWLIVATGFSLSWNGIAEGHSEGKLLNS